MKNEHPALNATGTHAPVLQSVSAHGKLEGLLLSMTLRQSFRNPSEENMEVVYTFPLAWGAVLVNLQASLGGKRMTGQVMARREARERYEDAVEKGDAPVMVEKAKGGVFSASLGSLKPGEEAIIELTYAQLLSFDQGRIRLVVPTTIAPRYGDAIRQGGLSVEQVAPSDFLAEHGFSLMVTLCGTVAQSRIGSPSHSIAQQRAEDGVTVILKGSSYLDRDFVLLLENLDGHSFAIAGPDARSGRGHTALIASYCLAVPRQTPAPLRLKILVDCSGSMAGDSIKQARNALRPLAAQLRPQDQVSYSRFGSETQRVLRAVEATGRGIRALLDAINETEADLGGTEMAEAMRDTFDIRMDAGRQAEEADVLLITDGEVWDAQRIVDEARRSGHRVYALGVGSAPAESLLREMAQATGGTCEFATPNEDMSTAVQRLLSKIRESFAVKAHLETPTTPLWCSPLPRRLAAGETTHLLMRLPSHPAHAPALHLDGLVTQSELSVREDDLIPRLVAAREISLIADTSEASALAERYQLVTENTNLLLVIERAESEKTDGMPTLHQVRAMAAAGWGGTSTVTEPSRIRFSSREPSGPKVLRSDSDLVPVDAVKFLAQAVWRSDRSGAAARVVDPAAGVIDGSEVPAFLRKASAKTPTFDLNGSTGADELMNSRQRQGASTWATPEQIIAAFNASALLHTLFRPALRAVTALSLETGLRQAITEAAIEAGGAIKVWACYLLWLHEKGMPGPCLNAQALALIHDQIKGISPHVKVTYFQIFSSDMHKYTSDPSRQY